MEFLLSKVLPVLVTAIVSAGVGVVAWIVTNFLAEPLLHFYRQRRAIRESVFFTRNISKETDREFMVEAQDELRRHAATMEALWTTAPRFIKRHLTQRGFDPMAASAALTGLSNSFHSPHGERSILRDAIERALKFPRSSTDEQIKATRERLDRGEP